MEIKRNINEECMTIIIKDILSMDNEDVWMNNTVKDKISIKFIGNMHNVKYEILKWLTLPERLYKIIRFKD